MTAAAMSAARLSREQRNAAADLAGPVRVLAGAGTGKTTVIVERFRRLVRAGVDPASILVMTFTERAAGDLRERIESVLGMAPPAVGTFHALALRWLREERSGALGAGFRVVSGPERWILLRELMWEIGHPALVGVERPDDLVQPLLGLLERVKQELVPLSRLGAWAAAVEDPERRELYLAATQLFERHAAWCRARNVADFDDLLLRVVRLLERDRRARARFRSRHPWVMVDEYQDTNTAQERLVELLGAPDGNVAVVGDDDQSIYRFRGASQASLDRFLERFPKARTLTLSRNRRSTGAIVASARALILHDQHRLAKEITALPRLGRGQQVEVSRYSDGEQEAQQIAGRIGELHASGIDWARFAVLTRTHAIAEPVLRALTAAGTPFQQRGGPGLYRQPEVRDLVAYLRLLAEPSDVLSLARLLLRPPLRVDLEAAMSIVRRGLGEVPGAALAPLHRLAGWPRTAGWAKAMLDVVPLAEVLGVEDLLYEVMERTRHVDALVRATGGDPTRVAVDRLLANVDRFRAQVAEFASEHRDQSLAAYLRHLDLVLLSGVDEATPGVELGDAVHVMTMHQAKGLEFEVAFLPSVAEGRLPQIVRGPQLDLPADLAEPRVRGRADHVGEERRLLYVGMTRARRRLCLSWAEQYEGARRWRPSRFLTELSEPEAQWMGGRPAVAAEEHPRRQVLEPGPERPGPEATLDRDGRAVGAEGSRPAWRPILSYSAISAYRECPLHYWYRYRLRLPVPPTVEGQLGTIVHEAIAGAGRRRQEGRRTTEDDLQDLYQDAWDGTALAEPRRRPVLEALGWTWLERLWRQGGLDGCPTQVEAPFAVDLDGWTLRGVIDRVEVDEAGRARIVDFKTGRRLPASELRRDLQLALYAVGARSGLGLGRSPVGSSPLTLDLVYLRTGERVSLQPEPALLERAQAIGREVAERVQEGAFEARPSARRCRVCPYRLACPSGQ